MKLLLENIKYEDYQWLIWRFEGLLPPYLKLNTCIVALSVSGTVGIVPHTKNDNTGLKGN